MNIFGERKTLLLPKHCLFSHYDRGVVFHSIYAGRGKEALVNYRTALHLNPNHALALVSMGRHLRTTGNIREAEEAYKRFVLGRRTLCAAPATTTTTTTTLLCFTPELRK